MTSRSHVLPPVFLVFLILAAAVLAGCGGGGASESAPPPGGGGKGNSGFLADRPAPDALDRLIVRNGSITAYADNVSAALDGVAGLAGELGGFVVTSRITGEGESQFASATLRVPSERFDEALSRIRSLAAKVGDMTTSSEDVTEEYVDMQARLSNLEETEQEFVRLLERAQNVTDVLSVQRELNTTRGEIERTKGRIQYLEQTAAMSLINVSILPTVAAKPIVRRGWSALDTARESLSALSSFAQGLADIAIRLAIFGPVWAPLAVATALLARWWSRRSRTPDARPSWLPPAPPPGASAGPGAAAAPPRDAT